MTPRDQRYFTRKRVQKIMKRERLWQRILDHENGRHTWLNYITNA